jgi:hypothetical protein
MGESALKIVFQGSEIEAVMAVNVLESNKIPTRRINHYQNNLNVGWVTPGQSPENAVDVLVNSEDFTIAQRILNDFFSRYDEENKA